jgi:hypothetical protein
MKAQSIYDLLQKRAQQAGLASIAPNDFRRSFLKAQQTNQILSQPE